MTAIYSNIYSGLYNQPVEDMEEEGVGLDEIENTSFYSNIYYSYDDDEDNDDTSVRSGKKSSNVTSNIPDNDDLDVNDVIKAANTRPPLLSSTSKTGEEGIEATKNDDYNVFNKNGREDESDSTSQEVITKVH